MTAGAKSGWRVHSATSRPSGASAASLSAEPEVPMTRAPSALPSCSDATPTPDDTPLTSSHSPAFSRPCSTSMSKATRKVSGMLAACSHDRLGGHRHRLGRLHQRVLRERRRAAAHDAVAGTKAGDVGADGDDLARAFAADRLPAAGLAVQAVAEQELAAVQRGGVHAHEQLAGAAVGTGLSRSSSVVAESVICIHQDCIVFFLFRSATQASRRRRRDSRPRP